MCEVGGTGAAVLGAPGQLCRGPRGSSSRGGGPLALGPQGWGVGGATRGSTQSVLLEIFIKFDALFYEIRPIFPPRHFSSHVKGWEIGRS